MTIQELEYFYDLAQTLSFSMTAERLYVTQPVVSKHIRLLEESLGYPLIDRSIRKRIRLTKSGELLFQCLQTCRSSWNETLKKISELQDTTQISYYLPEDQILPQHIVSKFDEFRKLSARNTPAFKILEKGQAKEILSEKGFLILPDYMEIKGNYDQRRIQTNRNDSLMLISAASHPAAEKDLHAYAGSPLFLPDYLSLQASNYLYNIYKEIFGIAPEVLILDSSVTLVMYLLANIGITINTSWYAWLNDSRLMATPLKVPVKHNIIWDPETYHPASALTFARSLSKG